MKNCAFVPALTFFTSNCNFGYHVLIALYYENYCSSRNWCISVIQRALRSWKNGGAHFVFNWRTLQQSLSTAWNITIDTSAPSGRFYQKIDVWSNLKYLNFIIVSAYSSEPKIFTDFVLSCTAILHFNGKQIAGWCDNIHCIRFHVHWSVRLFEAGIFWLRWMSTSDFKWQFLHFATASTTTGFVEPNPLTSIQLKLCILRTVAIYEKYKNSDKFIKTKQNFDIVFFAWPELFTLYNMMLLPSPCHQKNKKRALDLINALHKIALLGFNFVLHIKHYCKRPICLQHKFSGIEILNWSDFSV